MPHPSVVRIATEKDRLGIVRLLLQGHKENGAFAPAPDRVHWWLTRALSPELIPEWDDGPRGVIGVIGPTDDIEAMVFLTFGQYWYTNERHIEEFIVYVEPDSRKSNHAKALICWMRDQSDQTGLPLVSGVISNHRTEAKVRLYRRTLPKAGEFFIYRPNGR